jgi:lipooligosaccharide transport system ATP-binding protein
VLTTHYMDEAEQLCDRLVIMDGGRIVAEGSPRELITEYSTREVIELRFADDQARSAAASRVATVGSRREELADRVLVYTNTGEADAERLASLGVNGAAVLIRRSSLEDVFLTLTGRSLDEE